MTDQRVKLTNEMFQGIRAIKSYSWEKAFADQLISIRREEIRTLKACANVRAILVSMLSASPSIVAVVVLSLYALLGNSLTPVKVFTALALFNQLRFPLIFLPILLNNLTEGKLSLQRLSDFFSANEVLDYVKRVAVEDKGAPAVSISNGNFAWTVGEEIAKDTKEKNDDEKALDRGRLKDVNLEVKDGELVAVVGPVGSGKSSLVSAILGELHQTGAGGEVAVKGRVAYVSQTAWIPNDSLKNVVLFGNPYDERRYQQVIRDCGLSRDIEILEAGDETEIGERAVNLSGGQKQRLNLARAVYDDADVYLLDDPLSALDSDVGSRVFRECVRGSLGGKTRLLITHQLNVLPEVDRVVIMTRDERDGSSAVLDQGTFSELVARGHDLSKVVEQKSDTEEATGEEPSVSPEEVPSAKVELSPVGQSTAASSDEPPLPIAEPVARAETKVASEADTPADCVKVKEAVAAPVKLMSVEERAEGAVELHTYRSYIKAANSPLLLCLILASFGLANASQQFQQWVVAAWTSDAGYVKRPLGMYLFGVSLMAAGVALFNWSRTFLGAFFGAGASEEMHREMVTSVLRAPLTFFESTPVGRLIQRFTRDLDQIDQQLPGSFGQFVASTLNIISAMVAIAVVTPSFAVFGVPILVVYMFITNFYRQVARELKRLDSVSRSPVFAHFGESLDGLSVIRSFRRQELFRRGNEVRLEDSNAAYYALKVVDRWLSVRLELLGNAIVFFSSLLVVLTTARAGTSGLSINNALGVTGLLNWAVRNGAELESLMNSVERVRYTTNQTPQELSVAPALPVEQEGVAPAAAAGPGWPWRGGVRFENAAMRYRADFQLVLRGVDLDVRPGEMVGVVGRTGSGKSSLFRSLLRLTELEGGTISIDGVDISKIDLDVLRSSVAIIPQEPVLFSGSIRRNLDPFGTRSDDELWAALRRSNLEPTINSLQGGLDFEVSEGGENFSLGQRQLLCLARALVRKSRILLLDEATSSIDYNTDLIIQRTIREEASRSGCTVITIAHRLDTIMDSDRVLVMDNGQVAEYDSPANLLAQRGSLLSKLVEADKQQLPGRSESTV
jgi:ABC-type multidrug transport system fused ATPase/permease subunit